MSSRGRTITRNFAVLSAGQIAAKLLAFVVTIRLTRALETDAFGMVVFATSVLAYATMVIDFGLDALGAIEIARGAIPVPDLVRCIVSIRAALLGIAFTLLLAFAAFAPIAPATRVVLILYGLSLLAEVFHLDWTFLGMEEMKPVAIAEIVTQVVLATGVLLLVHSPADVYRVPLLYVAGRALAVASIAARFVRRFGPIGFGIDRKLAGRLLRDALPLTGSAGVSMLLNNIDLVLVGLMMGAGAAGLYGAAYRIVWLPTMVAMAYYAALAPTLAKASVAGLQTIETLLARSVRLTGSLAVLFVVTSRFLSGHVLELLYGRDYSGAHRTLTLLLVAFSLLVVSRNFRLLLVCFAKQRIDFVIIAFAAAMNVALNLILIPRRGIEGAALATVASEAWILLAGYVATRLVIGHVSLGRALVRPILAGIPLAATLYLSGPIPLFSGALHVILRAAVGCIVYVATLFACRAISIDDVRTFAAALLPIRPGRESSETPAPVVAPGEGSETIAAGGPSIAREL